MSKKSLSKLSVGEKLAVAKKSHLSKITKTTQIWQSDEHLWAMDGARRREIYGAEWEGTVEFYSNPSYPKGAFPHRRSIPTSWARTSKSSTRRACRSRRRAARRANTGFTTCTCRTCSSTFDFWQNHQKIRFLSNYSQTQSPNLSHQLGIDESLSKLTT